MKRVNLAILGFGTVGYGVYKLATENAGDYEHRENISLVVKRVLIRGYEQEPNAPKAPRGIFATDIRKIVEDEEISIVCECMGGVEPARTFILAALKAGKTVVTSNKEVVARHWPEFEMAAKAGDAGFYFEATAGGGIPVVRTLLDAMQANNIDLLFGIVNGTTNYILTKMAQEGASFGTALKEAQSLGYAEANPAADVEGWDCVYKLSILASIAFHARVEVESIYREGIREITAEDIAIAKELGYVIKLLAIGKKIGGSHGDLQVRVHPTMLPASHPLANVNGVFNGIFLHGHAVDDIMLYGRGAGQMPTASAVMSDVIYAAKQHEHVYMTFDNTFGAPQTLTLRQDWQSGYCVRISVNDETGVLREVAAAFAAEDVSIHSVIQRAHDLAAKRTSIVIITHEAREKAVQRSVERLKELPCVQAVDSLMRVER